MMLKAIAQVPNTSFAAHCKESTRRWGEKTLDIALSDKILKKITLKSVSHSVNIVYILN